MTTTNSRRRTIILSNDDTSLQAELNLRSSLMTSSNSKTSLLDFNRPINKALRKKTSARSLKDSSKLGDKLDSMKQIKETSNERDPVISTTSDKMQTYSLLSRNIKHKDQIIQKFLATCENSQKEALALKNELEKCEDITRQIYYILQDPYMDELNAVLLADQVKDVQNSAGRMLNMHRRPKAIIPSAEDLPISKTTSNRDLYLRKSLGFLASGELQVPQTTSYKLLSTKRSRMSGLTSRTQVFGAIPSSEIPATLQRLLKRAKSVLESV